MNITISNRGRRRISLNGRYIASIAGAVIVGGLLIRLGSWQDSGNSPAPAHVSPVQVTRPAQGQSHHFYIVATEAERAAIVNANDELATIGPRPSITVLLAGDEATASLLNDAVTALAQVNTDVIVTDTTSGPGAGRVQAESTAEYAAREAEMLAAYNAGPFSTTQRGGAH